MKDTQVKQPRPNSPQMVRQDSALSSMVLHHQAALPSCGSLQVDIEKDLESSSRCYTFSKEGSCTWRMLQLQLGPFLSASRGVPAAGGHRAAPMAQCIPPKISFHSLSCPWPPAFPVVLKVALTQSWPDQEPGLF